MELENVFGPGAKFRDDDQKKSLEFVLKKEKVLVVQKTGWGKSLIYFLATKIFRARGEGVTIIISPLLSLARNQINSTEKYKIVAESINSQDNNTIEERENIISRCNSGLCDVLFITPEQLENEEFITMLGRLKVALFVVDEAHCISDWGHDFRPDYMRIKQFLNVLPSNIAVLATTATANNRVIQDISQQLGDCEIIRGPLQRKSLNLHKVKCESTEERYAWVSKNIQALPGSGIIYASTIMECERLSNWLRVNQIEAYPCHSRIAQDDKVALEEKLINNEIKVLVSTIALGMGFDKEDIEFIIHYYTPKSMTEYYQQIGRAGRNISEAYCILLYGGKEEERINNFFIKNSFPKEEDIYQVLSYLEAHDQAREGEIAANINIKINVLKQVLKLLSIEGFIVREKSLYYRTAKYYTSNTRHYEKIIQMKVDEYRILLQYSLEKSCLMQFITKELDDPFSKPCGKCSNCIQSWEITIDLISAEEKEQVSMFFEQQFILIEPRIRSSIPGKGKLSYSFEPGFALSYYYETLGQEARKNKYLDGEFSNFIIDTAKRKLEWFFSVNKIAKERVVIVPIPSNRRPTLVYNFARTLSNLLNCEFADVLAKKSNEAEQKSFLNSQQQEANIRNHLYVKNDRNLTDRIILLVDDFVDSKWTFSVAAEILSVANQSIEVIPFAISDTSGSD